MGKIIVGQNSQKVYESGSLSLGKSDEKSGDATLRKIYTDEEKEKIINAIVGSLPKARIPAALRSAGLNEEADMYEKKFTEEEEAKRREVRLSEIRVLPEAEQLPILLAEGYEEEAKELSERLAEAEKENADNAGGDLSETPDDEKSGEEAPKDDVEQPKKPARRGTRNSSRKR